MKILYHIFFLVFIAFLGCETPGFFSKPSAYKNVKGYVTTFDQSRKLYGFQPELQGSIGNSELITINSSKRYQTMDGFGYTLTGGSAQHLIGLPSDKRYAILKELFGADVNDINVSYLRISIGSSDLDEKAFSYNDIDPDTTDLTLDHFSLHEDENDLIPVLKEILTINPNLSIMASPWSAPAWMKTNKCTKGGSLIPAYFDVYANYFVNYIRSMQEHGINIEAITIQNEPLHPGNNPSMYMTPEDQAAFIKSSLGPKFEAEGIITKIIIYDHNADRVDYPLSILNDPEANKYIDGSAFHLYGGTIDNLEELHLAHPDKNLYFTEQWIGAPGNFKTDFVWHMKNIMIGAPRNWCKVVLEWNLSSNLSLQPHTPGGCTQCLGALTIEGENIIKNPAYFIIGQTSKFVPKGAQRIFSTDSETMPNITYLTPAGDIVLIVLNEDEVDKSLSINLDGKKFQLKTHAQSAVTYVFKK